MARFVVDAYAWMEYLEGSEKGKKFAEIIENEANECFTASATVAEVISNILRKNKDTKVALKYINDFSRDVFISQEIGTLAGQIHFESKKKTKGFGMLDAFVAATAKKLNAKILTGDEHFKDFKEAVFA